MTREDCLDAVLSALTTAREENGSPRGIYGNEQVKLGFACTVIADMTENDVDDNDIEFVSAAASRTELSIMLNCKFSLILMNGRMHPFYDLIDMFDRVSFSKAGENLLRVALTMDIIL